VAAFVMDGTQGDPGAAAAESLANRVFATTGQDSATP
jgi:hypothetical protein